MPKSVYRGDCDSKCVDVAGECLWGLFETKFWCNVVKSPYAFERIRRFHSGRLRQTKVTKKCVYIIGYENVAPVDVTMYDAGILPVQKCDGRGHFVELAAANDKRSSSDSCQSITYQPGDISFGMFYGVL